MKKEFSVSVVILSIGFFGGMHTANSAYSRPLQTVMSQQVISKPTIILSDSQYPIGRCRTIYEDSNYVFVERSYGPKGKQVPGLFVFSNKMKKWMEIKKLSTKDAKLGRSPTLKEGLCPVWWDYSSLQKSDYATLPLMTSGSINFPDKILYKPVDATYLLQFNSSWNIKAVLTQFIVKKDDLDKAYDKQGECLTKPDAPADTDKLHR